MFKKKKKERKKEKESMPNGDFHQSIMMKR
jgi:hypothetical protein